MLFCFCPYYTKSGFNKEAEQYCSGKVSLFHLTQQNDIHFNFHFFIFHLLPSSLHSFLEAKMPPSIDDWKAILMALGLGDETSSCSDLSFLLFVQSHINNQQRFQLTDHHRRLNNRVRDRGYALREMEEMHPREFGKMFRMSRDAFNVLHDKIREEVDEHIQKHGMFAINSVKLLVF